MLEKPIKYSQDFLVKATLGRTEVMQDFLASRLPKETRRRINLQSLRLTNKSFAPKTGKNKHRHIRRCY